MTHIWNIDETVIDWEYAESDVTPCPKCQGLGWHADEGTICDACDGTGNVPNIQPLEQ